MKFNRKKFKVVKVLRCVERDLTIGSELRSNIPDNTVRYKTSKNKEKLKVFVQEVVVEESGVKSIMILPLFGEWTNFNPPIQKPDYRMILRGMKKPGDFVTI